MVSATQQSSRIRKRKSRRNGTSNKRELRAHGTPKFAIHLEGYDQKAPDAPRLAAEKK
jgi:small subunit ribosomal protein S20